MIDKSLLAANAIDRKELSSNFADIASGCDCTLAGATLRQEIVNNFPLVTWLLGTQMSRAMRERFSLDYVEKSDSGWSLKVPASVWTEPANSSSSECCWVPFDFAKCCGTVPINLLCLKSCDPVIDSLIHRDVMIGANQAVAGISNTGERVSDVDDRINKMSLAFYTAYTAILGLDETYTNILKPFHGLLSVLENSAVMSIYAADVLSAFDQLWCRLSVLGGDYVIAVNPLIYATIDAAVIKGQNGDYPAGWTKDGDVITFHGIGFIQDKLVPVDVESGTGEAWVLESSSVGLFLATDLLVGEDYIERGAVDTSEDNCGSKCDYYYNYGAAFGNNANKIAKIVDIPVMGACASSLADLSGVINPETLIPQGI